MNVECIISQLDFTISHFVITMLVGADFPVHDWKPINALTEYVDVREKVSEISVCAAVRSEVNKRVNSH